MHQELNTSASIIMKGSCGERSWAAVPGLAFPRRNFWKLSLLTQDDYFMIPQTLWHGESWMGAIEEWQGKVHC